MTTDTDPAARRGLPAKPFCAGWYKIVGDSDNRLPAGQHLAFIHVMPDSSRLLVEVEIAGFLPMQLAGHRDTVEAMIAGEWRG